MTTVRVYPGAANPTHDLRLSDDAQEFGLIYAGGPTVLQEQPISKGSEPFEITQKTWTGGSGFARYTDNPNGFYDSVRLWTMSENRILNGLAAGFGTGFRNSDFTYTPGKDVVWQPLYGSTRYAAAKLTASANYNFTAFRVILRRRGSPGSVIFSLHSNNAGAPGTQLQTVTYTASQISDDFVSFWFTANTPTQAVTATTIYWLKVSTASTDDDSNHWEVGVDLLAVSGAYSSDNTNWTTGVNAFYYQTVDDTTFTDSRKRLRMYYFDYYGAKYAVYNASLYINGDRGTATAGSTTTLTDGGKAWATNRWAGARVKIIDGVGDGMTRLIVSNTATALTVSPAFDATPTTASVYVIYDTPYWTTLTGHGLTVVTGSPAVADKIVYFPQGGTAIRRMRINGSTHEYAADGTNTASDLAVFTHATAGLQVIRASDSAAQVSRANAVAWGANLTFGTNYKIGGSETKITNIFIHNGQPYVGKEEGVYSFINDQPKFLASGMQDNLDNNNGFAATSFQNALFVSWGHSISQLVGSSFIDLLNWRQNFDGLHTDRRGDISQIIGVIGWLFFSVDGGTSNYSSVYAWNGQGLHEVYRSPQVGLRIRNITWQTNNDSNGRLWINESNQMIYIDFPYQAANPLKDTAQNYHWESVLVTGTIEGNDPAFKKLLHSLQMTVRDLGTTGSVEVDYQINDDVDGSAWIRATQWNTSPVDESVLDIGGVNRFRLRVRLITIDADVPVVVEKITAVGWSIEPIKYQWIGQFVTASGQTTYTGAPDHDPNQLIDWLRAKAENMDKITIRSMRKSMDDRVVTIMTPTVVQDWVSGDKWGGRFTAVLREA